MKRGSEIGSLRKLIVDLERTGRKGKAPIWTRVAYMLSKPTRQRCEVNLNKINSVTNDGDVIVIPGKVLGIGKIEKKVKVAAFRFSKSAISKMAKAGIEHVSIEKLLATNAKGAKVRIIV
ncbi:MAG: 50S ribosomal protein L18e [Candidatus Micrarchaeota archaeon]